MSDRLASPRFDRPLPSSTSLGFTLYVRSGVLVHTRTRDSRAGDPPVFEIVLDAGRDVPHAGAPASALRAVAAAEPAVRRVVSSTWPVPCTITSGAIDDGRRLRVRWDAGTLGGDARDRAIGRLSTELAALAVRLRTAEPAETAQSSPDPALTPLDDARVGAPTPAPALTEALLEQVQLDAADVEAVWPVTPMQEAIVLHDAREPGSTAYVQQLVLTLSGTLQVDAFVAAWTALAARHPVLRARLALGPDGPRQVIRRDPQLAFRVVTTTDVEAVATAERALDLQRGPLWRLAIAQTAPDVVIVIWTFSHALLDGWCFNILFNDLAALYAAAIEGRAAALPPAPPLSAALGWLSTRDVDAARRAFAEALRGCTEPTGLPRDVAPGGDRDPRVHTFALEADTTTALQRVAAAGGVTIGAVLQAVWAVLLAQYHQTSDVVYGLTVSGRPPDMPGALHTVGCFINTVPIRVTVRPDDTLATVAAVVQQRYLSLQDHQHLPLAEIQAESPLRSALLDHVFVFENYPWRESVASLLPGVRVSASTHREELPYAFGIVCALAQGRVHVRLHFDASVHSPRAITALAAHVQRVCTSAAADPLPPLHALSLLDDDEYAQVVTAWNRTAHPLAATSTLVDVFEAACRRTPHAIALHADDTARAAESYDVLWQRAQALARRLRRDHGASTDVLIGICLPRSARFIRTMLAVLTSGGAYLPLDPSLPTTRLRALLDASGVRTVLTDTAGAARLDGGPWTCVDLDACTDDVSTDETLPPLADPASLAYVIYTSGSSGQPKGALIQHRSVVNRLQWMQRAYPLDASDVLLQKTPIGFDVSVWELLWWMWAGASVVALPDGAEKDPAAIVEAVARHRVTTLHFVPSMLDAFLAHLDEQGGRERLASLRRIFVSGEALTAPQIARVRTLVGVPLINLYGPTEATVDVSHFDTADWDGGSVPIGRPIDNTALYVLNAHLSPVPVGVAGEVVIGGVGLARGYLGQPALTAERFRPDPFGDGARVYLTGDRGRFDADGRVHYLGRLDAQVKIRGHRVELGEVEAHLLAQPGVRQAAVRLIDGRLVAYIVGTTTGLAARLREVVPDAFVPSQFVVMETLPLTPSGKLDRRALPAALPGPAVVEPPRNALERAIVDACAEILGHPLGRDDDFFEAGGHSLNALRASSRIARALQVAVTVRDLFAHSTPAALAACLRERAPSRFLPMPTAPGGTDVPLSHAQQRMWAETMLGRRYHIPGAVRVRGALDVERLQLALDRVVARHEALRTTIVLADDAWRQRVHAAMSVPVQVTPVGPDGVDTLDEAMRAMASAAFDLARGPLLRVAVFTLAPDDAVLMLTVHHLVCDGWSLGLLLREWMAAYGDLSTEAVLAPARPYRDVVAWQSALESSGAMAVHAAHWRVACTPPPPALDLGADHPRRTAGDAADAITLVWPPRLAADLRALSRRSGASLFMTLTAVVHALLHRTTGTTDIATGTAVSGRERAELDEVVGLLVNTVVLRSAVTGAMSFADLLGAVRHTATAAFDHQVYPFDRLVDDVRPVVEAGRTPFVDVMVTLAAPLPDVSLPGASVEPVVLPPVQARFDLTWAFADVGDAIEMRLEYRAALYARERMARMAAHCLRIAEAVVAAPDGALALLPMVSADERAWLHAQSGADAARPSDTVVSAFARVVDRAPEAVAVRDGAVAVRYRELDARANGLAMWLRQLGVRRESRVALCLPAGVDAIVAILAVLKAGGAYTPIDPAWPSARVSDVLEDLSPVVVLSDAPVDTAVPVCRTSAWPASGEWHGEAPAPGDAAYVLYTSGSTGRPKGVVIEHASLAQYVQWALGAYGARDWPLFTSLSVDLTVTSLFLPLVSGHAVHVCAGDAAAALRAIVSHDTLDVVKLTPSHIAVLAGLEVSTTRLRLVVVGGEALTASHLDTLRRLHPSMRVVNEYGPTEATVGCVAAEACEDTPSVIGRPVAGARVWVVDRDGALVPRGAWGELWVSGPGLARGYHAAPALTAERFVPCAVGGVVRAYRTGDRVRWREDGQLDYGGRFDAQVKVRGHRVELGDIEAHLTAVPGVRAGAVALHDTVLVAYVVGEATAVLETLRQRLPPALMPAHVVTLEALPLLPSGKLDRAALPAPALTPRAAVAPRTVEEQLVAAAFADALGQPVSVDDDFFAAGGHSLSAMQAAVRLNRDTGRDVSLRDIFAHPTVASLAQVLSQVDVAPATIAPVPDADDYAVSDAQRRMWLLVEMGGRYAMPGALRLEGALDGPRLERAITAVVARHEALRTRVVLAGDALRQVIDADARVDVRWVDLSTAPQPTEAAAAWMARDGAQPFDLERGPVLRTAVLRLAPHVHVLWLVVHHIAADGASLEYVLHDVAREYAGAPVSAPAFRYRDYAAWRAADATSPAMAAHRAYWHRVLGGHLPVLELPTDRPRGAVRGSDGDRVVVTFAADDRAAVMEWAQTLGATPFMALVALVTLVLHRVTGQDDIIVGTPVSGRDRAEWQDVVGLFVNTIALRERVDATRGFEALLAAVRETAVAAYAHQAYPFDQLVDALAAQREPGRHPFFDVMVVLAPPSSPTPAFDDVVATPFPVTSSESRFDLTFAFGEVNDTLGLAIEYRTDLFDRASIERLARQCAVLLRAAVADPARPLAQLPMLAPDEVRQCVADAAGPPAPRALPMLPACVEATVAEAPGRVAVRSGDAVLTYAALDARANAVAQALHARGIGRGAVVAVACARSPWWIAALLGVWKVGAVYLPIDLSNPAARRAEMLGDSAARVVLADHDADDALDIRTLDLCADGPSVPVTVTDPAYLIYTSGSTGHPKGAMITHGALANMAAAQSVDLSLSAGDRVAQFAAIGFDASLYELTLAWRAGAAITLVPETAKRDAAEFLTWLAAEQPSMLVLPPAFLRALERVPLPGVRVLVTAGEAADPDDLRHYARTLRAVNAYGPTECAVCATWHRVDSDGEGAVPIGRAVSGTTAHVLDRAGQVVPEGVAGELYLGGAGVGVGYVGRPDLTAERFVPDPFVPGARLFRTGDRVRRRAGGVLEFLGRVDAQVKVRGVRIEPAEVERHLRMCDGVSDAVVVVQDGALVAYVVGNGVHEPAAIRAHMAAQLPPSMQPSQYVSLARLPVTSSGKVDHRALPPPAATSLPGRAPADDIERAVVDIIADVLHTAVGPDDNFFDRGGHSVRAMQVAARVRQRFGVVVPLRAFFAHPTPAAVAAMIRRGVVVADTPIVPVPDATDYPASHAQRRLWVLSRLGGRYVMPVALRVNGPIDDERLHRAMITLVARHESLRTRFTMVDAEVRQCLVPIGAVPVERVAVADDAAVEAWLLAASAAPFDLERGPLARLALLTITPVRHVVALVLHHAIADAWSLEVLLDELVQLYARPDGLAPLSVQYRDYAVWQSRELADGALARSGAYWRAQLSGELPILALPADLPRAAVRASSGAVVPMSFSVEDVAGLQEIARRTSASLFMVVVALVKVLLHRYTGQTDIIVGSPVAGRVRPELDAQVGLFVNTVALRDRIHGRDTFEAIVRRVAQTTTAAFEHQAYPFDVLVDELGVSRDLARSPVFDVLVSMLETTPPARRLGNAALEPITIPLVESKVDLTISLYREGATLTGDLVFSDQLFTRARIERMATHLRALAAAVTDAPSTPIAVLPIETASIDTAPAHREAVAADAGADGETVVSVFETQSARHAARTAVSDGNATLSFAELNARANGVAAWLRNVHGAGPEARVAVVARPSVWWVVAALGVLKSGAAYVPVPLDAGADRRARLCAISDARVCIGGPDAGDGAVDISRLAPVSANPDRRAGPAHLAYVMATSGSTGEPKGVLIEHRALMNFVRWQMRAASIDAESRASLYASIGFDASVWELWAFLLAGASVHAVPADARLDMRALSAFAHARSLTHLFVPTPLVEPVLDAGVPPTTRVCAGGEALVLSAPPDRPVLNLYGPAECTVASTCEAITTAGAASIGYPIDGVEVLVLDPSGTTVPVGVDGEICLAGAGLARGYAGDAALTAARFTPHPTMPGARLYRTGDRGRVDEAGRLWFRGRLDDQLKVRGQRVEPGEIEAALTALPGVRRAAVSLRQGALVAWVVGACDDARAELRRVLPESLVPSRILVVDELPLTSHGKVDRRRLAEYPLPEDGTADDLPAADAIEAAVAQAVQQVLGHRVGRQSNFFEVGGHSLLAMQLVNRVSRDLRVTLPLSEVFHTPTVAGVAAAVRRLGPAHAAPLPRCAGDDGVASFAQQRMWVRHYWGLPDHMPLVWRLRGPVDRALLIEALRAVVRQHDTLRTTYAMDGDILRQRVHAAARIDVVTAATATEDALAGLVRDVVTRAFDLAAGPVVRVAVIDVADDEIVLVVVVHHIAGDGESLRVLARDLRAAYAGQPLAPVTDRYLDYAAWQRAAARDDLWPDDRAYWIRQLADVTPLALPLDHPRRAALGGAGEALHVVFRPDEAAAIRRVATAHGASLFMTLAALVTALLHRHTGQDDIAVGTPVSGRTRLEFETQVGLFVNTVVLRQRVHGGQSFAAHLAAMRNTAVEAWTHQTYPFDLVVEDLGATRDPQRHPLFDVMVQLVTGRRDEAVTFDGVESVPWTAPIGGSKFDLTFSFAEVDEALSLTLEYRTDLFDRDRIERLAAQVMVLARAAAHDATVPLGDVDLLTDGERARVLAQTPALGGEIAPARVWAQVAARPDGVAVIAGGTRLTYAELGMRAAALAARLRAAGVVREARVALWLEPSIDAVVAMLAVWHAGGVYVPIDPALPPARVVALVDDIAPVVVLTTAARVPLLPPHVRAWRVADGAEAVTRAAADTASSMSAADAAYVIYTSGSTGTPKGVVVEHAQLAQYLAWAEATFAGGEAVSMPLFTSLAVDLTITSVWLPLVTGGVVHVLPTEPDRALIAAFSTPGITTVKLTPSHVSMLASLPVSHTAVGCAIVGGEALTWAHIDVLRRLAPTMRIVNEYGPTEATVGCVADEVDVRARHEHDEPDVRIGRPIDGASAWVIDARGVLVPLGVWGELLVAGAGVARGYLNQPALTAARFVPMADGRRGYRTGDRVRWQRRRTASGMDDVALEYGGRADDQIKVRGHRVELGEIEHHVRAVPGVRQACVRVRDGRLVAYVVGTCTDLRTHLRAVLPPALVPDHVVMLDALPVTVGGKVDVAALPEPVHATPALAPVADAVDRVVRDAFTLALGHAVGGDDDFFAAGGHSLAAVRVTHAVAQALGVQLTLADLFAAPTPSTLADIVRARGPMAAPDSIERIPDAAHYPVSPAQRRLWVLAQMGAPYHMPTALRLRGPIDRDRLAEALRTVVARHETLRARFTVVDGALRQHIDTDVPCALAVVHLPGADPDAVMGHARAVADAPFDLARGPLVRACLIETAPDDAVFVLVMHHLVSDGESLAVLEREILAAYRGDALPPLQVRYRDYCAWHAHALTSGALDDARAYWHRTLHGDLAALSLPADHARPADRTFAGDRLGVSFTLEETAALDALGRRFGATRFMTLVALVKAVLYRYTGERDVIVGSPVSGRARAELAGAVGLYANTVVLRDAVIGHEPFSALLRKVRTTTIGAMDHQAYPFDRLVDELAPLRTPGRQPIFDVWVSLTETSAPSATLDGVAVEAVPLADASSKFDLSVAGAERDGALHVGIEFSTELFTRERMARLAEHFVQLTRAVLRDPETPVAAVRLGAGAPPVRTSTVEPSDTLMDRFERQVARTPTHVAVSDATTRLTYRALDARANAVANRLRALGVGPESRVGVAAPRTIDLMVAIVGILKAGAAYVPLDLSYPAERLAWVAADAGVQVIVTTTALIDTLPVRASAYVCVDADDLVPAEMPPPVWRDPRLAAYVIYTSGSTGTPKGVVVEHRQVVRLFEATARGIDADAQDVWTLFHAYGFDFSVWEIWGALLHGGRLVIVPDDVRRSPPDLCAWLARERVTVLNQTPSAFGALLDRGLAAVALPDLRLVIFGGEALDPRRLRGWFAARGDARPAVINMYGITETTVHVTARRIRAADVERDASPIGEAMDDLQVSLIDRDGGPVLGDAPGEIVVSGPGVARGYLNRPDLTADRFRPDPWSAVPGARCYVSGDLARRIGGEVEYLGRRDAQVKVRGYRIELGEIEAVLARAPGVASCLVMAENRQGEARLVAYAVPHGPPDVAAWRAHLRAALPEHMLPAAFVPVDAWPLTRHGKIDRAALPAPSSLRVTSRGPRDATEHAVARAWARVLGLERVNVDDHFFDAGGDSLSAVRLIAAIESELGVRVPLGALFRAPTVEALAMAVRHRRRGDAPASLVVPLRTGGDDVPLVLVHPAGGTVFCYGALVDALPRTRPVVAIQAAGLDDDEAPLERVEAMAARYVAELRRVHPSGRVLLGGWSFGGLVALEMARLLDATAAPAAGVVLIDTHPPVGVAGSVLDHPEALADLVAPALAMPADALRALAPAARLDALVEAARAAGLVPVDFDRADARRLVSVYDAIMRALAHHEVRPTAAPVLWLRTASGAARGWLPATAACQPVPGTHQSVLSVPHVRVVADACEAWVRAQGR